MYDLIFRTQTGTRFISADVMIFSRHDGPRRAARAGRIWPASYCCPTRSATTRWVAPRASRRRVRVLQLVAKTTSRRGSRRRAGRRARLSSRNPRPSQQFLESPDDQILSEQEAPAWPPVRLPFFRNEITLMPDDPKAPNAAPKAKAKTKEVTLTGTHSFNGQTYGPEGHRARRSPELDKAGAVVHPEGSASAANQTRARSFSSAPNTGGVNTGEGRPRRDRRRDWHGRLMPVVASDLMAPNGPVDVLFPKEGRRQMLQRLTQYLANGYADSRVATLASDLSPVRQAGPRLGVVSAHTAVADRMSAQPLTVAVTEKGSSTYSAAQIQNAARPRRAVLLGGNLDGLLNVTPYGKPSQFPGSLSSRFGSCSDAHDRDALTWIAGHPLLSEKYLGLQDDDQRHAHHDGGSAARSGNRRASVSGRRGGAAVARRRAPGEFPTPTGRGSAHQQIGEQHAPKYDRVPRSLPEPARLGYRRARHGASRPSRSPCRAYDQG